MSERLSWSDLRTLDAAIRSLYERVNLERFPHHVVPILRRLVPADFVPYEEMNLARSRTVGVTDPPEARPQGELMRVWERHISEHPVIAHYTNTPDRRPLAISDFWSREHYHRQALYREFYRHFGTEDQLGIFVTHEHDLMVAAAFSRSRRSFTKRDRLMLSVLQPHLVQAYRNAEALSDLEAELHRARGALDALDHGVVGLRPDGTILLWNDAARRLLGLYCPNWHPWQQSRLPEPVARWVARLRGEFAHGPTTPTTDSPGGFAAVGFPPLLLEAEHGRLVIRLIAASSHEPMLVLEHRPRAAAAVNPAVGALPPRLRPLLDLLLEGDSEKQVAQKLKLTRGTVHQYVKQLYRLLDVSSRAELLARFVQKPAED